MSEVVNLAKNEIPSIDYIIDETWNKLKIKKSQLKNNLCKVLIEFDLKAAEKSKRKKLKKFLKILLPKMIWKNL